MPNILEQPNSADECDRLYRQSLSTPQLLAEIQHHCELLVKAIDESVTGLSEAERGEFESERTCQREPGHDYADLAEVTGSPRQNLIARNLGYHITILLD